ncbi:hypothetical protein LEL_01935 [Akanthomyces lecanii RCEF 1005]|uniref:Secondary alcohol dehydrogenase n=1 Tax=Akanthomyces lecanii RCEF 1005 TaxID=1081108 RepID=A0A168KX07_CORDF|nr:hypothetical protein LEL_01935 [Akanthomyces lecanii RCEF 1005]
MSSADTTPISPARFAAALKDLSVTMLHLKVLEIRNSIAHLQYSNDQLRPFADGTATAASSGAAAATAAASPGEPDQDCVDAIRENEQVVERMAERIALVRMEVEERGVSWDEFTSKEETEAAVARAREEQRQRAAAAAAAQRQGGEDVTGVAEQVNGVASSPWTDGTFQTGTIRNGEVRMDAQPGARTNGAGGGSLSDEQLRAAMEERMRQMTTGDEDQDENGGMHL